MQFNSTHKKTSNGVSLESKDSHSGQHASKTSSAEIKVGELIDNIGRLHAVKLANTWK